MNSCSWSLRIRPAPSTAWKKPGAKVVSVGIWLISAGFPVSSRPSPACTATMLSTLASQAASKMLRAAVDRIQTEWAWHNVLVPKGTTKASSFAGRLWAFQTLSSTHSSSHRWGFCLQRSRVEDHEITDANLPGNRYIVCMYVCTYVRTYVRTLFVCLFVCLFICLFVCLFICLFVCLFVCLYV